MKTITYVTIENNGEEITRASIEMIVTINGVEMPSAHSAVYYEEAEKIATWASTVGTIDISTEYSTTYVVE